MNMRVYGKQMSIPSEEVCKEDIYATAEKFPLGEIDKEKWYKMVFASPTFFGPDAKVNLGGHALNGKQDVLHFLIAHYHSRCVEVEMEINKRVLERHNYISPLDTDETTSKKLAKKLRCQGDQLCANSCRPKGFNSFHKAVSYMKWLSCREDYVQQFYRHGGNGTFYQDMLDVWRISEQKFGL